MKNSIFYTLIISILFISFSCSRDNDDSSSNQNPTTRKLIGKWYFTDPSTHPTVNNSFTFTSDGKVTYTYWGGGSTSDYDNETGTFKTEGDKLTMIYPGNVTLTFVQKVVFVTDKKVEFVATGNPNEHPYAGDYFKTN